MCDDIGKKRFRKPDWRDKISKKGTWEKEKGGYFFGSGMIVFAHFWGHSVRKPEG